MRRAAVLLLLPLLAGCGQPAPTSDTARPAAGPADQPARDQQPADPAALLRGITGATEAAGTVRYSSVTESARDGEPPSVEGRLTGELDLAAGAGTGRLQLPALDELATGAEAAGDASAGADLAAVSDLALSWTAAQLTVVVGGERHTTARDSGDSGVVGRVPTEPAGLLDAVAAATDAAVAGEQEVDGVRTTRLTGALEPRAAVDAGLGTQAQRSIAQTSTIPVEVWVDRDGRPARIRFVADVPSMDGRTRTMTTTYDYRGWGQPVDVTP